LLGEFRHQAGFSMISVCSSHALRCCLSLTVTILAFCGQACAWGQVPGGLVPVELEKQLLVDDYVIGSRENVTRRLEPVAKANEGKPIFHEGWFYGTVLYDEQRFKLWWRKPGQQGFAVAESQDGVNFRTVADVQGINFAGDYTLSVSLDLHATDPGHRFKAAYDAPGMAAGIAHSGDGIHWTPYHNGRPVTHRAADTYNQIVWDEQAVTYRLFTRTDFGSAGGRNEIRGTRSMTNPDVHRDPAAWTIVDEWKFDREGPDEVQRRQIYAVTDWIYHGVHFGLLTVYEWPGDVSEGGADLQKRHERDVMNVYLATRRGNAPWDLSWVYGQQPLVPRGGDGDFDKDLILPASTIVTHDDQHWLYYSGANERHGTPEVSFPRSHAIGLARLPLDRLIGLAAGEAAGTVETRPFVFRGNALSVNVKGIGGEFRVEVLDRDGRDWPGYSATDAPPFRDLDQLRFQPAWRNGRNAAELAGKVIRLRFHLRRAALYSFQVTP
jgi:hypothetical protein